MTINTINQAKNHSQIIAEEIRTNDELPFKDVLSTQMLNTVLSNIDYRDRVYSPMLTLFGFLSQVMGADQSCQAALAQITAYLISQDIDPPSANTAAYCKARTRLPETLISELTKASAKELEAQAPSQWLWRGCHVKLVDGSTVSMPDTPKNQAVYPQPKSQKKGIGFPIARIVGVVSLATGAVLDLSIGAYSGKETGEHALLRELMSNFSEGDIMLGDCYYPSFFLLAKLQQMGVDGLFPIHASRKYNFRCGKHLGKKDHFVEWTKPCRPKWMSQETYEQFPNNITVREVEISSQKKGFRAKTRVMVTTMLDASKVTKQELSLLYDSRWFVEISFKSIKETMRMDILRGRTPEMVRKEIWIHLLAYNLIRKIMAQSAHKYFSRPRNLSFKLAMQFISVFRQCGNISESSPAYECLLKAIAHKRVGNRPGRSEPRKVKRRPKAFPRLQKPRSYYHKEVA